MLDAYTFVEGASLPALILEIKDAFLRAHPYELDEVRTPNALRLIALEAFERRDSAQQLAVLHDLVATNRDFTFSGAAGAAFEAADSPAAVISDLVAAVVCQVLERSPSLRRENEWRIEAAAESAAEAAS